MPAKSIFRFLTLLFFFAISSSVNSQHFVFSGKVVDAANNEPLAFVNIIAQPGKAGAMTDIDGKFVLKSETAVQSLILSYVGYKPLEIIPEQKTDIIIKMTSAQIELSEIEIKPGINPANRIIEKAFENRYLNDYEHIESFTYKSYEKMTFGPESDTLPEVDSLQNDTTYAKMRDFFRKSYIFLMESITERYFMFPDKNLNKVVASKVSGMSDPTFVFLVSQMQSTSFYKEMITIGDKTYINPISNGSTRKYYFEIKDTLIEPFPYDTTYIISFRPLLNTNFDGLNGTISISTNQFAIRNVIAEPAKTSGTNVTMKIQQLYDWVGDSHWFPVQLNTDLIIINSIGNGTLSVGVGSDDPDSAKSSKADLVGRGKSYITDIVLNAPLKKNKFGFIDVDVSPNAYHESENVWIAGRYAPLSAKDSTTYQKLEKMGKEANLDKTGKKVDALINGRWNAGKVDILLNDLFGINKLEKFRLGLGLQTNRSLSQRLMIGAYAGYGFGDGKFKYRADAEVNILESQLAKVNFSYYNNLLESSVNDGFIKSNNALNKELYRDWYVKNMDQVKGWTAGYSQHILRHFDIGFNFMVQKKAPQYQYSYMLPGSNDYIELSQVFNTTEAAVKVRFAFNEKYISTTHGLISMGTKAPIFLFAYTRGLEGVASGAYNYNRYDFQVDYSRPTKYYGTTSLKMKAGLIDTQLPKPLLYSLRAGYSAFGLYSPNSFATMRYDEFIADSYLNIFLSHDFGNLLFKTKKFKPEPVLVTNFAIGGLKNADYHVLNNYRAPGKGYFESGIVVNRLLGLAFMNLGAGVFYRYGAYSLPKTIDNFSFKLSVGFGL
jgi:hypothetical protein